MKGRGPDCGHGHAREALAIDGGTQGAGGGLRPPALDLGAPARGGQPPAFLRPRRGGRLRGDAPADAGGALGGAHRPRRRGRRARGRGGLARPRGAGRPAPAPGPGPARVHRGRADRAGRRRAAPRLRRLPSIAPHRRAVASGLPPRPRLRQRGGGLAARLGRIDLRGRGGAARPPPLPRPLGRGAQPRGLARGRGPAGAARRGPGLGRGDGRIRLGAPRGARGMAAMTPALSSRAPSGPLATRWARYRDALALVGPTRRRLHSVLVVGAGLAGASAAATLSELGYRVRCLVFHDSPRRAHSVAAQGGINAAKNYQNHGDSVERLFHDTPEGGDFRSREANVYRLAELSTRIIDHAVAQGVPFAREYGGHLANRSFGGALVSRTFYARGQTGQQLLLGAYGALAKEEAAGGVTVLARREMLDLVVVEGRARGVVARDLVSGALEVHVADAVVLATGGYANVYFLSTNAKASNATAIWRAHRRGAAFANPGFVQFHPTCLPAAGDHQAKLTLMSESLRNDGRLWVPLRAGDERRPQAIPQAERDYFLERRYPPYGHPVPRDLGSRACKALVDEGRGAGPGGRGVYLDLTDAARRVGADVLRERYRNLLELYEHINRDDTLRRAMRIAPAAHYSMGGLWVDYDLMSTIPGLFVIGEANFSDQGANRLGASALMQGLADGYFILPYTLAGYLDGARP